MALRICCAEESRAHELADELTVAGYAATTETEAPLGDTPGPVTYVVQTDAAAELVADLLAEEDSTGVRLELSDPMSGTNAVIDPPV